jgi:hypothetical protein
LQADAFNVRHHVTHFFKNFGNVLVISAQIKSLFHSLNDPEILFSLAGCLDCLATSMTGLDAAPEPIPSNKAATKEAW